jgi:vacuolar iron transporter family protein
MDTNTLNPEIISILLKFQKNEITEHFIYKKLSEKVKGDNNKDILKKISNEEKAHYDFFKRFTQQEIAPNKLLITFYFWISRILGLTFGLKLMEKGESNAQINYEKVKAAIPEIARIEEDEVAHEKELIDLIEEEKLEYVGSIVLGLNDALVELTGALAGLSFALQNTRLIALAGLITGIAASFSMAASQYLSQKAENSPTALKSSLYTGAAYILTVALLILPYLLFSNFMVCLAFTLAVAILIILFFNYYISVAKDLDFRKRFFEMAFISIGVSAITFGIGVLIRQFLGIDI